MTLLNHFKVDPESGRFLVTLYNRGQYGASIYCVKCDGKDVTFHATIKSGHHLPAQEESVVEVVPCVSLSKKPDHKVTFEVGYLEFSFELTT